MIASKYFSSILQVINCCDFPCLLRSNPSSHPMDIFGFPYSDDDEEEYTPPKDEVEGEKENDNYVASDSLSDGIDFGAGAGDYSVAGEHIQRCES